MDQSRAADHRRTAVTCFFSFGGAKAKSGVPGNYDEVHSQAIAAVESGLQGGLRRLEVDFPPLGALNKMGDGSAKGRQLMLTNNCIFIVKLVSALSRSRKVLVLTCEPGQINELRKLIPTSGTSKIELASLPNGVKLNAENFTQKGVVIVFSPADSDQWRTASKIGSLVPTIVVNGLFNNGYADFTPTYYFKPISGWGYLIKKHPENWIVYSSSGAKIACDVDMISSGDMSRPNLGKVSTRLQSEWGKLEALKRQ